MKAMMLALLMGLGLVGLVLPGWLHAACEPLAFVGAGCEKNNLDVCSLSSSTVPLEIGSIDPFDGSNPGAVVQIPSPEWYKTNDESGAPAGGYCVPTTDAALVGKQWAKVGYYRATGNGTNFINWTQPTYRTSLGAIINGLPLEETLHVVVKYKVEAGIGGGIFCIKALVERDKPGFTGLISSDPVGSACAYVPATGATMDLNIPDTVMGDFDPGDESVLKVFTQGTSSGGIFRMQQMQQTFYPHE